MNHTGHPKNKNKKGKLVLIHWNDAEWRELAAPLEDQDWQVVPMAGTKGFKLKDPPQERPAAVLISLRRLPSHGREVAEAVWHAKWARQAIRIIFVDGTPDAVEVTRARFPAATFTTYENLASVLG